MAFECRHGPDSGDAIAQDIRSDEVSGNSCGIDSEPRLGSDSRLYIRQRVGQGAAYITGGAVGQNAAHPTYAWQARAPFGTSAMVHSRSCARPASGFEEGANHL